MRAPSRGVGRGPGAGAAVHVTPSNSHVVSVPIAPPLPPNSTALPMPAWKHIATLWRGPGPAGVVICCQFPPSYSYVLADVVDMSSMPPYTTVRLRALSKHEPWFSTAFGVVDVTTCDHVWPSNSHVSFSPTGTSENEPPNRTN